MNTNVPEVQGSSDELEALAMKLAGNEVFASCRGNLDIDISCVLDDLLRTTENATQFCVKFDEYFGRVKVMGNLLATLRRDGKKAAEEELRRALSTRDLVLTHEEVPLSDTTPAVVLMLEPAKTLTLIKWMDEAPMIETLLFTGLPLRRERSNIIQVSQTTRDLFKAIPELHTATQEMYAAGGNNGPELGQAYRESLSNLPQSFDGALQLASTNAMRLLNTSDSGGSGEAFTFPLGHLFLGKRQDEVLRLFSREDQGRIATWQLQIPTLPLRYNQTFEDVNIWFHPEGEHAHWSRCLRSFSSRGVSNGYGAMFVCLSSGRDARNKYTGIPSVLGLYDSTSRDPDARTRHGLCIKKDRRQIIQALKACGILDKDWEPIKSLV